MGVIREHVIKRFGRAKGWYRTRKEHKRKHPHCENCGSKWLVEVHHILPVHLFPEEELNPENLMSLCSRRKCHLMLGHLGNYKLFNTGAFRLALNNMEEKLSITAMKKNWTEKHKKKLKRRKWSRY